MGATEGSGRARQLFGAFEVGGHVLVFWVRKKTGWLEDWPTKKKQGGETEKKQTEAVWWDLPGAPQYQRIT